MTKKAVSFTIDEDNLLWLKGRAGHRRGTLSRAVDDLISEARAGRLGTPPTPRSVVGTIDLGAGDPELNEADRAIRHLFDRALSRPSVAREKAPAYGRRPRARKPRRG